MKKLLHDILKLVYQIKNAVLYYRTSCSLFFNHNKEHGSILENEMEE